jgi:hypothetical protein
MSDPNDHFVLLQNRVTARLEATDDSIPAPVPANGNPVPYLSEQKGDIATKIQAALNGLGIGVIILTPTALMIDPSAPDLGMYAPVLVQVQENVLINQGANGTKIPALRLVSFIMKRLQGWSHQLYAGSQNGQRLRLDTKPFVLIKDGSPLTYNVAAIAMIDLGATLAT